MVDLCVVWTQLNASTLTHGSIGPIARLDAESSGGENRQTDCIIRPIRLALLSSKMQISPDKSNNLCITDINCY